MSASLIDTISGYISPQITDTIATRLGESSSATQRGLLGGAATIFSGIASRSGEPGFMERIFNLVTSSTNDTSIQSRLTSMASGGQATGIADLGTKLLSGVFGSQQSSIAQAIGRGAGLKDGSASNILSMAAPLVLGVLGQRVRDQNLGPSSMGSMLSSEAAGWQSYLPSGLSGLLGGARHAVSTVGSAAATATGTVKARTSSTRWALPVIALLVLAGLLWYFLGGKRTDLTASVQNSADRAANGISSLGEFLSRRLPNGVSLSIPRNGIEYRLIDFIEDRSKPADDATWFNFDRLLFNTGEASLNARSQEQVDNIANILKAYPSVKVKIGGYTDNTGDPVSNQKLSTDRANAVRNAVIQAGVSPERVSAEGFGQEHPVADNSTEEGRAQNRRIALRVVEK